MKNMSPPTVRLWICGLSSVWLLAGCSSTPVHADATLPGFAVVELFTSEGCSSCPPADKVLGELAQEAERSQADIYTLAFHVDYWDSLGWRDPYSALWATQHQRAYAAALHGRGLYTPQMVVNGRDEFIGSHGTQARANIASSVAEPRRHQLQLEVRSDAQRVSVHFELGAPPIAASVLRIALVEAEAIDTVKAGENAGRVLHHVHVVRAFETMPLASDSKGDVSLVWPADFGPAQRAASSVVVYVQQRDNMEIIAASSASVSTSAHVTPKHQS
jgi:hypothetical protein